MALRQRQNSRHRNSMLLCSATNRVARGQGKGAAADDGGRPIRPRASARESIMIGVGTNQMACGRPERWSTRHGSVRSTAAVPDAVGIIYGRSGHPRQCHAERAVKKIPPVRGSDVLKAAQPDGSVQSGTRETHQPLRPTMRLWRMGRGASGTSFREPGYVPHIPCWPALFDRLHQRSAPPHRQRRGLDGGRDDVSFARPHGTGIARG